MASRGSRVGRRACSSATWGASSWRRGLPDACIDDGQLDVGVLTAESRIHWLRVGVRAVFGRIDAPPLVQITQAATAKIRLDRTMPWELDGGAVPHQEARRLGPARARPDPGALRMSGAVDVVGRGSATQHDRWVRAWPLRKPASSILPSARWCCSP